MTTEDDILIDNYLKGLLSKDAQQAFIERLESDKKFKTHFELEKQLFDALDDENWSFVDHKAADINDYKSILEEDSFKKLRATIADANSEFNAKKTVGNRRLFFYLAAATIVIFLGFQFFLNQSISNQDLYKDYIALNDLPSFISRGNANADLVKAQHLFENKEYEEALSIFQSQLDQSENKGNVYIYKGISQIELKRFSEAEETFNALINSNLLDAEKGYWYKALLFIKSDRIEEAKASLIKINSQAFYNKEKAKALLAKLKDE